MTDVQTAPDLKGMLRDILGAQIKAEMRMRRRPLRIIGSHNRADNESFAHFILTWFNVDIHSSIWRKRKGISVEDWFEHRMGLFSNFCASSVNAQTSKDFTWLLICDARTPNNMLTRIKDVAGPNAEIILMGGRSGKWRTPERMQILSDAVRCRAGKVDHVLTSLLDNDDCLHRDYVRQMQQRVPDEYPAVLSFRNYYVYEQQTKRTKRADYLANPYITLVEPGNGPLKTACIAAHGSLQRFFPFVEMPNQTEMMLQVCHEHNLVNSLFGADADTVSLEDFGVPND